MKKSISVGRGAFAIFCDDVRLEAGGKLSFMGVYHGHLMIPLPHVVLPRLCAVIHLRTPAAEPFQELTFRLMRGEEVLVTHRVEKPVIPTMPSGTPDAADGEPSFSNTSVLHISPFEISADCVLLARVETESEILKAGGLVIRTNAVHQA